jgi:hypothetical protein
LVENGSVVSDFFYISSPHFSIFSLVAILVGSRDHRTQFWKGAIQGSFHKSLIAIGPVVSEKIFMAMTKATFVNFFYRSYQVLLTDVVIIPR